MFKILGNILRYDSFLNKKIQAKIMHENEIQIYKDLFDFLLNVQSNSKQKESNYKCLIFSKVLNFYLKCQIIFEKQ